MSAKWGIWAIALVCLALSIGCQNTNPKVKPADEPERFSLPPDRLNTPGLRKEAFDAPIDPAKRMYEERNNGGIVPTRGSQMGGMGGAMGAGGTGQMR